MPDALSSSDRATRSIIRAGDLRATCDVHSNRPAAIMPPPAHLPHPDPERRAGVGPVSAAPSGSAGILTISRFRDTKRCTSSA
ncbi:hypothetical protein [Dactylosporangium salmoneum]|uniref:hypothetical protein n=1 Tax=Dactylosporangium salmoneum TaxID=53361 RepID=UPI0031D68C8B